MRVAFAGPDDDLVQFKKVLLFADLLQLSRECRKHLTVMAGADFVQDLSQAVNVCLNGSGTFGRDKPFGADQRRRTLHISHKTDIRNLGNAVYENNVGGFDIPMDEAVFVQVAQAGRQRQAESQTFLKGQATTVKHLPFERLGLIGGGINFFGGNRIIAQLHDVIEAIILVVPAHLENIDQVVMRAGHRLELLDAVELPLVRAFVREGLSIDDFDRAISTHHISRQPYLTITAAAYAPKQLVIGNVRRLTPDRAQQAGVSSTGCQWQAFRHNP